MSPNMTSSLYTVGIFSYRYLLESNSTAKFLAVPPNTERTSVWRVHEEMASGQDYTPDTDLACRLGEPAQSPRVTSHPAT